MKNILINNKIRGVQAKLGIRAINSSASEHKTIRFRSKWQVSTHHIRCSPLNPDVFMPVWPHCQTCVPFCCSWGPVWTPEEGKVPWPQLSASQLAPNPQFISLQYHHANASEKKLRPMNDCREAANKTTTTLLRCARVTYLTGVKSHQVYWWYQHHYIQPLYKKGLKLMVVSLSCSRLGKRREENFFICLQSCLLHKPNLFAFSKCKSSGSCPQLYQYGETGNLKAGKTAQVSALINHQSLTKLSLTFLGRTLKDSVYRCGKTAHFVLSLQLRGQSRSEGVWRWMSRTQSHWRKEKI